MECDTLSVKSVNEACVVPYQENKFNRTKKPLEATCELLTGIVGLLRLPRQVLSKITVV